MYGKMAYIKPAEKQSEKWRLPENMNDGLRTVKM